MCDWACKTYATHANDIPLATLPAAIPRAPSPTAQLPRHRRTRAWEHDDDDDDDDDDEHHSTPQDRQLRSGEALFATTTTTCSSTTTTTSNDQSLSHHEGPPHYGPVLDIITPCPRRSSLTPSSKGSGDREKSLSQSHLPSHSHSHTRASSLASAPLERTTSNIIQLQHERGEKKAWIRRVWGEYVSIPVEAEGRRDHLGESCIHDGG